MLLTTRNKESSIALGIDTIDVGELTPQEAVELLELWANTSDPLHAEIADRLGYLPLALKLGGGRLREGTSAKQYLERFQRVSQIRLGKLSDDPKDNLKVSIEVSVNHLPEKDRPLYHTLGIFPEDVHIPLPTVTRLWCALVPDQCKDDCEELVILLDRLALVDVQWDHETLTMHDLLHDYNEEQLEGKETAIHQTLLEAFNPKHIPWYHMNQIDDDGYLFRHLPYHMQRAKRDSDLEDLLTSAPRWLLGFAEGHTLQQRVMMEQTLLTLWDIYWQRNPSRAHKFLTQWLQSTPSTTRHYNPQLLAARCAFASQQADLLARALHSRDPETQDAAVKYVFYLESRRDQTAAALGIDVLKASSKRVMKYGVIPDKNSLAVLMPLVVLLLVERYRSMMEQSKLEEISHILVEILDKVTYARFSWGPLGPVTNAARTLLIKALKPKINSIFKLSEIEGELQPGEMPLSSSNNTPEEFARFFEFEPETRDVLYAIVPYLDRTHYSLLDIKEQALEIFETEEMFSRAFVAFVIIARAIEAPEEVYSVFRYIFDGIKSKYASHDPNMLAGVAESIGHNWYTALDLQPKDKIQPKWLDFQKELVLCHIEQSHKTLGYGTTTTKLPIRYLYYTLMYYGAIWNKLYPFVRIDLLDHYLSLANETNDRDLLLYIIDSLGERATFPQHYTSILESVRNLLASDDTEIVNHLVAALAVIRNKQSLQVDQFLQRNNAPASLIERIEQASYDESIFELVRRTREFVATFLMHVDKETIQRVIASVDRVVRVKDVDDAVELALKELINGILGKKVFLD